MAENITKKYVDLSGLTNYDAKIKALIEAKDTATLQSAKDYADGLADNYESAGAAATALADAKAYADEKDDDIAAAKKAGDDAADDAAAAAAAAAAAQSAADAAQGDVDALEVVVGTASVEGGAAATGLTKRIEDLEGLAGVGSVQTQIQTSINALDATVGSQTVETGKHVAVEIVETDGKLTGVTVTEGDIASAAALATLVGTDTGKSARSIANEELAKQLIAENADEALDTLQEIADWIQSHPGDAAAMNSAIEALETLVGELPEGVTATTIVGYIAEAVAAEKSRAEGAESGLSGRLTAVEGKLGTGEDSVSSLIATAKSEAIEAAAADATAKAGTAKSEAIEAAATDAAAKVKALEEGAVATNAGAISAVEGRMTTAEGEIDALQTDAHTHSNKNVLDGIDATKVNAWDTAATNSHTHSNKTVLDEITEAKVNAWDAAESNAKSYADGLVGQFVAVTTDEINALFPTQTA